LQLLAALTCDPLAAQLCNVVNSGSREDAYQVIYNFMCGLTKDTAKISREDVKQAIMTAFYSSKAVPKQVFGEGALLDVFYSSLEKLAPAAWELNEAMLALWNPNALEHAWMLPDNFHVHVKVMSQVRETVQFLGEKYDVYYSVNSPMAEGRSLGANTIHSVDGMIVRELTRRCDYDAEKVDRLITILNEGEVGGRSTDRFDDQMVITLWRHFQETGYLSARIINHIDLKNLGHVHAVEIFNLLKSLPDRPFKVVSIHDCFRCLPHYGNDLRAQYNLQLQLIAKSNLLASIISQLVGRPVNIGKLDPQLWTQIQHTDYALS
jgi:hypothetical protein